MARLARLADLNRSISRVEYAVRRADLIRLYNGLDLESPSRACPICRQRPKTGVDLATLCSTDG